jgi:CBS domain-containing protein
MKLPRIADALLPARRAQDVGRLVALCALLGVVAGLGAIVFELVTAVAQRGLLDGLAGYRPERAAGDHALFGASTTPFRAWVLALLPIGGGLVGGALVLALAPEAEGHGTDAVVDAYHHKRGRIRAVVPLVKTVLAKLTVGNALRDAGERPLVTVRKDTRLSEILARFGETHHVCFPIVDAAERLTGVVDDRALRQAASSDAFMHQAVVAADLVEDAPLLTPNETLHSAMRKMVVSGHAELVVVAESDVNKVVGALSRRDLIHSYDQHVQRHRGDEQGPASRL